VVTGELINLIQMINSCSINYPTHQCDITPERANDRKSFSPKSLLTVRKILMRGIAALRFQLHD
jgi:hypothetical protein